jgi:nitroreductase
MEYQEFHLKRNYPLDENLIRLISDLQSKIDHFSLTTQKVITKIDYFKYVNAGFNEFSKSRASVRNYSDLDLPMTKIMAALDLARSAPSACNRQAWRTYVYSDKKKIKTILEYQGGNRGFGHLTSKLIIVTGELGVFSSTNERNQVFIDGGIYSMNLLYCLHFEQIAACILNCSFDYSKEEEIKRYCSIKSSEVLIAMISCGLPPEEFGIANSPRHNLDQTNTIV